MAGQRINQGDLIAALDETTLQNAYDMSAATLAQAEDAYQRMKQLHDNNSLPEMQWVEVQNQLKQARSAEQIAKKNLTDGKLYAPFSGVISEKNVEIGQNVMPGIPVAKLVTVGQVKVSIAVPENEIAHIRMGQAVCVNVPALEGKSFEGKIVEKGISANPLSRSYEVKALIKNPSGELLPGMICDLSVLSKEEDSAIVLPSNVIQIDDANQTFVWVNRNGKAEKQVIQTEMLTRNGVVVAEGLNIGDEIITEGQQKVSEKMDITIDK